MTPALTARGPGSIPEWETKIPQAMCYGQRKEERKKTAVREAGAVTTTKSWETHRLQTHFPSSVPDIVALLACSSGQK